MLDRELKRIFMRSKQPTQGSKIFFLLTTEENVIKMSQRRAKLKFTLFFIAFICVKHCTSEAASPPPGSVLFEDHGFVKKCFVQSDIALLATRLKFQDLLPNESGNNMLNDDGVTAIIRYFYGINEIIEAMSHDDIQQLMLTSFYDMLGRLVAFIIK